LYGPIDRQVFDRFESREAYLGEGRGGERGREYREEERDQPTLFSFCLPERGEKGNSHGLSLSFPLSSPPQGRKFPTEGVSTGWK